MRLSGGIGIGVFALFCVGSGPAIADCGEELQKLHAGFLEQAGEGAARPELIKLYQKAEKDLRSGREKLCLDATARANHLIGTSPLP